MVGTYAAGFDVLTMRYLGGKHKVKKWLAATILPRVQGRLFEPFHGGLSATVALQPYCASDAFKPLVDLVKAVRGGWLPPEDITKEEFYALRGGGTLEETFSRFACSFGGDWNGGYAKNRDPKTGRIFSYAPGSRTALLRKIAKTKNVNFCHRDYLWIDAKPGDTIYCDPPYAGTTSYGTGPFNHELFWDWCRWQASHGVLVFVSEFSGPSDLNFFPLANYKMKLHGAGAERPLEKLFVLPPQ